MIPSELFPAIVVHGILIGSIVGFVLSSLLGFFPHPYASALQKVVRTLSLVALVFSIYLEGSLSNQEKWEKRVLEAELKAAQIKAESETANRKLVEELSAEKIKTNKVVQDNLDKIKDLAQQIDTQCKIEQSVINVINDAAKNRVGETK